MFRSSMQESQQSEIVIHVENKTKQRAIESMLEFLCTGSVARYWRIRRVLELARVADEYLVPSLRVWCDKLLQFHFRTRIFAVDDLDVALILHIFMVGSTCNFKVKDECLKMLVTHFTSICGLKIFAEFTKTFPDTMTTILEALAEEARKANKTVGYLTL